jgi:hypothetical protein
MSCWPQTGGMPQQQQYATNAGMMMPPAPFMTQQQQQPNSMLMQQPQQMQQHQHPFNTTPAGGGMGQLQGQLQGLALQQRGNGAAVNPFTQQQQQLQSDPFATAPPPAPSAFAPGVPPVQSGQPLLSATLHLCYTKISYAVADQPDLIILRMPYHTVYAYACSCSVQFGLCITYTTVLAHVYC